MRTGTTAPEVVVDVRASIGAMRLIKDAQELGLMRRAAEISSGAHRRAMARTRPGWFEYQVEAELAHEFLRSVRAGGCVSVDRCLRAQRLRIALSRQQPGAAGERSAADRRGLRVRGLRLGRHTHVSSRRADSAGAQKAVYELVLATQLACIEAFAPGRPFHDYHQVAERALAEGLIDLKLCEGSLDAVLESGAYKQFYMHRAGHWLGLDVHDVGLYRVDGASRLLEPGMVLTVEPGCYIRPADNVPEEFWDIGVRIEDDVLVTATGSENLTGATPKSLSEVEAACAR